MTRSAGFAIEAYQYPLGSTQIGAGVKVATNETDFSQGSINSNGNETNVALNGSGFFVVNPGNGSNEYTRAGNFSLTSNGDLVTTNGLSVMGYPAANGVVNTNAPLTPIHIPVGQVQQPQATTTLNMTVNLNAAAGSAAIPAQVTVYDSLGTAHIATVTYTQTAPNTWSYSAALPAADFASGVATPVTGTLTFDANGVLQSVTPITPVLSAVPIPVGTAPGDISSIPLAFTGLTDAANDLNMSWNLLGSGNLPTVGQVSADSAVTATTQDGFTAGQYQDFAIGADGTVTVSYDNGQKQNVGQLALANVANVQGLEMLGNGDYATTLASGTASVGVSGRAGLGVLQGGALEGSNVNISQEFSNLIIAQRAFEANSKTVTTFDSVTQETINMIH